MNEIHESHLESGRPIKIVPILLQHLVPFDPPRYLVPNDSSPSTPPINALPKSPFMHEYDQSQAERKLQIIRQYPPLSTICSLSLTLIDGMNYPDSFHHAARDSIFQFIQDLQSDDQSRSQLILRRFNSVESGILQIRTRDLLTTSPFIRTSISTWNMNMELFEYNREFFDAINAESEEEYIRCSLSPQHLQLNHDIINTFRMRAGQLFEMAIVQEDRLITVFPCKLNQQPKKMNFVLKAIYDDANQLSGFICFTSVFEQEVEEGHVRQISQMMMQEEVCHEQFRCDLQPVQSPTFSREMSTILSSPIQYEPAMPLDPAPKRGGSKSKEIKMRKNIYMMTPDNYANPEMGDQKKPLGMIKTAKLMFKSYGGPKQPKRRKVDLN
eukprot:TRINITY_DN1645_c0_g1_i1.p1 TRINITY_DN1645_c0_g1~~TRINITY_DN1645_c0_g1_i1.p1  ORF type:complete len:383 (-),score=91.55 TRINITY_DN1645_c0_g1_i1:14-1162(-)